MTVLSWSQPDSLVTPTADISTVIVDKAWKAGLLLEHVEKKETPGLKLIILMEPFEEALQERGKKCGVLLKSMQAVEVRARVSLLAKPTAGWLLPWSCWFSALLVP